MVDRAFCLTGFVVMSMSVWGLAGAARHGLRQHGQRVQTFEREVTDQRAQVLDLLAVPTDCTRTSPGSAADIVG